MSKSLSSNVVFFFFLFVIRVRVWRRLYALFMGVPLGCVPFVALATFRSAALLSNFRVLVFVPASIRDLKDFATQTVFSAQFTLPSSWIDLVHKICATSRAQLLHVSECFCFVRHLKNKKPNEPSSMHQKKNFERKALLLVPKKPKLRVALVFGRARFYFHTSTAVRYRRVQKIFEFYLVICIFEDHNGLNRLWRKMTSPTPESPKWTGIFEFEDKLNSTVFKPRNNLLCWILSAWTTQGSNFVKSSIRFGWHDKVKLYRVRLCRFEKCCDF